MRRLMILGAGMPARILKLVLNPLPVVGLELPRIDTNDCEVVRETSLGIEPSTGMSDDGDVPHPFGGC